MVIAVLTFYRLRNKKRLTPASKRVEGFALRRSEATASAVRWAPNQQRITACWAPSRIPIEGATSFSVQLELGRSRGSPRQRPAHEHPVMGGLIERNGALDMALYRQRIGPIGVVARKADARRIVSRRPVRGWMDICASG